MLSMLALAVLKIIGYIDWSWCIITCPVWLWGIFKLLGVIYALYLLKTGKYKQFLPEKKKSGFEMRLDRMKADQERIREEMKQRKK